MMSKHVNNSGVHDATRGATVSARYGPIALHASILRLNGRLAEVDSLNCLPHIQPLEMVEYGSRTYVVLRICLPDWAHPCRVLDNAATTELSSETRALTDDLIRWLLGDKKQISQLKVQSRCQFRRASDVSVTAQRTSNVMEI